MQTTPNPETSHTVLRQKLVQIDTCNHADESKDKPSSNYQILKEVVKLVESDEFRYAASDRYDPKQDEWYESLLTNLFVVTLRRRESAIPLIQRALTKTDREEKDALDSFEQAYCALIDCHMDFLKKKRGLQQEVVNNHVKFQSLMDDIQVR